MLGFAPISGVPLGTSTLTSPMHLGMQRRIFPSSSALGAQRSATTK